MVEGLALQVAQNFANVSEEQICQLEYQVGMTAPDSLERHLLYALRVSKCVPNLRNLDTLVSRWGVAQSGAAGMGLDAARGSPHWSTIADFLSKLYRDKFHELAQQTVTTSIENAAKRKSEAAKQKVLDKGVAILVAAKDAFSFDVQCEVQSYIDRIDGFRKP